MKVNRGNISKTCNNITGGYKWEYKEKTTEVWFFQIEFILYKNIKELKSGLLKDRSLKTTLNYHYTL